jgi:hypothetical protein
MRKAFYERLVAHVNRNGWWHVPPLDPGAYPKRGMFCASTYKEAEFYGRPNDDPERVRIARPLVGDERAISRALGIPPQLSGMTLEEVAQHDARWRNAALALGYDSIVLMSAKGFSGFRANGKIPSSMELNVLHPQASTSAERKGIPRRTGPLGEDARGVSESGCAQLNGNQQRPRRGLPL